MRITGIFSNYTNNLNLNFDGRHKNNARKPVSEPQYQDVFVQEAGNITKFYCGDSKTTEVIYKNNKPYKDVYYDTHGKAQWVRTADGSFDMARNPWHEWKKAPYIELTKTEDGSTTRMYVKPPVEAKDDADGERGSFNVSITDDETGISKRASLYIEPDGTIETDHQENLPLLKNALIRLLIIILDDEYKEGFGSSNVFNEGVKKAIKILDEWNC